MNDFSVAVYNGKIVEIKRYVGKKFNYTLTAYFCKGKDGLFRVNGDGGFIEINDSRKLYLFQQKKSFAKYKKTDWINFISN